MSGGLKHPAGNGGILAIGPARHDGGAWGVLIAVPAGGCFVTLDPDEADRLADDLGTYAALARRPGSLPGKVPASSSEAIGRKDP